MVASESAEDASKNDTHSISTSSSSSTPSTSASTSNQQSPRIISPEDFWQRVATSIPAPNLRRAIDAEIRLIIRSPAIGQSLKGLLTAGLRKSVRYAAAKVRKWWYARGVDVKEKKKKLAKAGEEEAKDE